MARDHGLQLEDEGGGEGEEEEEGGGESRSGNRSGNRSKSRSRSRSRMGLSASLASHWFYRPFEPQLDAVTDEAASLLLTRLPSTQLRYVLSAVLCERRIIIVSASVEALSLCASAVVSLLYPFSWQHIFVPLLPAAMAEYACAPQPYILGVSPETLAVLRASFGSALGDVVYVHLDTGEVRTSKRCRRLPLIGDNSTLVAEALSRAEGGMDRGGWKGGGGGGGGRERGGRGEEEED